MFNILEYIVLILCIFLSIQFVITLLVNFKKGHFKHIQSKSMFVISILEWLLIGFFLLNPYLSKFHLLWAFPANMLGGAMIGTFLKNIGTLTSGVKIFKVSVILLIGGLIIWVTYYVLLNISPFEIF